MYIILLYSDDRLHIIVKVSIERLFSLTAPALSQPGANLQPGEVACSNRPGFKSPNALEHDSTIPPTS